MLQACELEEDYYGVYYDIYYPVVYVDYLDNVAVFDVKGRLLRGRVTRNQRKRFHDFMLDYFKDESENHKAEKWDLDNFSYTLSLILEGDGGDCIHINDLMQNLQNGHIDIRDYDNYHRGKNKS